MKFSLICIGIFAVIMLAAMPVQAYDAQTLTIAIDQVGNAHVNIQYSLNFFESAAIFTGIGDPSNKIRNELEYNIGHPVTMESVDGSEATFDIQNFATVSGKTYTTQAFTFQSMADKAKKYWFEGDSNFAPQTITIQFTDGYTDTYNNLITVPADTHTIQ